VELSRSCRADVLFESRPCWANFLPGFRLIKVEFFTGELQRTGFDFLPVELQSSVPDFSVGELFRKRRVDFNLVFKKQRVISVIR